MLAEVDCVLSPSNYVTQSFLARGFKPEQIWYNPYPVNLELFRPRTQPRPNRQPLTLINTGSLSLRKGTPYLLEAFRLVQKKIPAARLLLTALCRTTSNRFWLASATCPSNGRPACRTPRLAERLRSADLFILPSLEEGLVRTACEAMACGLPAILTPNTGANDFIQPGVNGEVVPIRDPQAIAEAVFKWAEKVLSSDWRPRVLVDPQLLSFDHFERMFMVNSGRWDGFELEPRSQNG